MSQKPIEDPKEDSFLGTSFVIYLVLAAVGALFLAVMGAYLYNRALFELPPIVIPNVFYISTFIVIFVSYLSTQANKHFNNDNFGKLFRVWIAILIFILLFMVFQMWGWYQLIETGFPASRNNSIGYMYALSALHLFHILIGIPFHIRILWKQFIVNRSESINQLEYLAVDKNKQGIVLMTRYWHFLDALWLALMIFFLIHSEMFISLF